MLPTAQRLQRTRHPVSGHHGWSWRLEAQLPLRGSCPFSVMQEARLHLGQGLRGMCDFVVQGWAGEQVENQGEGLGSLHEPHCECAQSALAECMAEK